MKYAESNSIICHASKKVVYDIIRDSSKWPERFGPCRAVTVLAKDHKSETIRITAVLNGIEMQWDTCRTFIDEISGINSKIIKPMKLVDAMDTRWRIIELKHDQCMLVLEHDYEICDEVTDQVDAVSTKEEALTFIRKAILNNSTQELQNIKNYAESYVQGGGNSYKKTTSHAIECHASAAEVYQLISDVSQWPTIFNNCIATTVLAKNENSEIIKISANIFDQETTWETHRHYVPHCFRIDFHLPVPMPLLDSMTGYWRVVPLASNKCVLSVERTFEIKEGEVNHDEISTREQALLLVNDFIEENTTAELQSIKWFVESRNTSELKFAAKYFLPFHPSKIYTTIYNAKQWPSFLPHCKKVSMHYDDGENQEFTLHINHAHGIEKLRSIRKCNADTLSIEYYQPTPPKVLAHHSGSWQLRKHKNGTEVISLHTVNINKTYCEKFFNETDLDVHKQRIKEMLLNNSKSMIEGLRGWLTCDSEIQ